MRFDIITIFPGFFDSPLDYGILKRARTAGLVEIATHDLRNFTHDRHRTVDDRPFGGGEGMVLKPEPLARALESLGIPPNPARGGKSSSGACSLFPDPCTILTSPQGRPFTQSIARELSQLDRVILICGRYEGVDERINQLYCDMELSIGDYVLSGGELAAAVVADAVMRLVPGVLGNQASSEFESFSITDEEIAASAEGVTRSQHGSGGLIASPHSPPQADFGGLRAPEI